jgi:hypothetical protein
MTDTLAKLSNAYATEGARSPVAHKAPFKPNAEAEAALALRDRDPAAYEKLGAFVHTSVTFYEQQRSQHQAATPPSPDAAIAAAAEFTTLDEVASALEASHAAGDVVGFDHPLWGRAAELRRQQMGGES